MAISTNSIIHYTRSIKPLKAILKDGFRLYYCNEILNLNGRNFNAAHPMISFCDIPLSNSYKHFTAYGRYGLGLSKDWAVANGINPVVYIDRESLLASSLHDLLKETNNPESNISKIQRSLILRVKAHTKNYSGKIERGGLKKDDYRYYDEREWRLVPDKKLLRGHSFSLGSSAYNKDKDLYNEKLSDIFIKFKIYDISYIIVKNTEEIPLMTNFLRSIYSSGCSADELDILFSKICSTEQIVADY